MDTLAKKIADAIDKFYGRFKDQKILKTTEEVEANTNENNLASAVVVGELINDLNQQPEWIRDASGKIIGYKTLDGGADTVFPFTPSMTIKIPVTVTGKAWDGNGVYFLTDTRSIDLTITISDGDISLNTNGFTSFNGFADYTQPISKAIGRLGVGVNGSVSFGAPILEV